MVVGCNLGAQTERDEEGDEWMEDAALKDEEDGVESEMVRPWLGGWAIC